MVKSSRVISEKGAKSLRPFLALSMSLQNGSVLRAYVKGLLTAGESAETVELSGGRKGGRGLVSCRLP